MGITATWEDDTKRIMRYNLDENWKWEEFYIAKSEGYDLINSVTHKVGVIVHVAKTTSLRPDILPNVRKALASTHPNTLLVVIVVSGSLAYTMLRQGYESIRANAVRVEIVRSLDEARRIVTQRLHEEALSSNP